MAEAATADAMSTCFTTLAMTATATGLLVTMLGPKPTPRVVWNASESVPIGLYRVQPAHRLIVTDLIVAFPPEDLATPLAEGGYLPRGIPLIKRVLALPGQIACRTDLTITVDGIEMGTARERGAFRLGLVGLWEVVAGSVSLPR